MNATKVLDILGELRILNFFPNDELAMVVLLRLCQSMCTSEEQVRWLVDRMTSGIYAEWPGLAEMRACFCNRYKPKDGIEAWSTVYPDGIPSEKETPAVAPLPPAPITEALPEVETSFRRGELRAIAAMVKRRVVARD